MISSAPSHYKNFLIPISWRDDVSESELDGYIIEYSKYQDPESAILSNKHYTDMDFYYED